MLTNTPSSRSDGKPSALFVASGAKTEELEPMVKAIDMATGDTRWEHKATAYPGVDGRSGLLATGDDLVFGACEGQLFAGYKDRTKLWWIGLSSMTSAAPISVTIDGHQATAIAAGRAMFVFRL